MPVLASEVGYRGMAISEGRTATNELMRLLQVDTWAMVRLFERLGQLARGV